MSPDTLPDRSGLPDRTGIAAAADRIGAHIRRTPVIDPGGGWPRLKLELLQHTGSFKPRGAFNRILSASVPPAGVIAASGGNHGLAVAHAAVELGLRAEIFVPEVAPEAKVSRLRATGATVHVTGRIYDEALAASASRAAETGALVVHAYDQPEVVCGQGTMGLELSEQAPDVDTVLVAVGGGGLIAGTACWYRGDVTLVSVEPERIPAMHRALEAGRPVEVDVDGIAADSLGARAVGALAYAAASQWVTSSVLVTDDAIRRTQRELWSRLRLVAEPGGACALAAVLEGAYVPSPGERVAVVVCGANCDPATVV